MKNTWLYLLLLSSALIWQSCGGASRQKDSVVTVESDSEGGSASVTLESNELEKAAREALSQLGKGDLKSGEVMDYKALQAILPDKLLGMPRTNMDGQKSGFQGINMSTASAVYETAARSVRVNLVDGGGSSITIAGLAMWANMDFERESDDGYERTTVIDGHKAFESYNKREQSGQLNLLINNRFVVSLEGESITAKDLRQAMEALDLKKLAKAK